jgi:hypothetical protein
MKKTSAGRSVGGAPVSPGGSSSARLARPGQAAHEAGDA